MTDFFLLLLSFAIWGVIWRFSARHWRKKGWGLVISHVCAGISGLLIALLVLVVIAPVNGNTNASTQQNGEKKSDKDSVQRTEQEASESTAVAELPQAFTGVSPTEKQWPTVASITVPVSSDERKYLRDMTCLDETECYGDTRFERYIMRTYPDLKKIRFIRGNDMSNDDEETVRMMRQQFIQGLYFAKQIKLANGQSLFDFMQSCSGGFRPNDSAESDYDSKNHLEYFSLQYFVRLRQLSNGRPLELDLLFDRRGDQIVANSPFFSSNALRYADFLARHHVECATTGRQ
ncbi:hypothetical protein PQQ51_31660 [Paraburkholderia xenovorans]|uniref:hypothetical protein n=1 Tax=Paraburkholderia xenovorans TaxID=36873 RepID=UPI0038BADA4D